MRTTLKTMPSETVGHAGLEMAGLRLDAAIARFDLAVRSGAFAGVPSMAEEDAAIDEFDRAETAFLAAQEVYRHELTKATGCDADTIRERLSR